MNQPDRLTNNATPLHIAAQLGHVEAVRALIEAKVSIEDEDMYKRTPLHTAASAGSTEVVELLANQGSRIDALTEDGDTPLMLAILRSKWSTASFLLGRSHKICVKRTNYRGENPMSYIAGMAGSEGIRMFHEVLDLGLELYESHIRGISSAFRLLIGPIHSCLRSLLNRHSRLLAPNRIRLPRSWREYMPRETLPGIAKGLRLLARCGFAAQELRHIAGLAAYTSDCPENHNLICQAARFGSLAALQDFAVVWGHNIYSLQCCDHGTLLDAALACRELEVVKFLVRDCAVEVTLDGITKCQTDTETDGLHEKDIDSPILRWLLVDRYTDQAKLTPDHTDPGHGLGDGVESRMHEHATDPPIREGADCEVPEATMAWRTPRPRWAHTVKVQLPFEWRQRRNETMWEYAIRRQAIIRSISEWQ